MSTDRERDITPFFNMSKEEQFAYLEYLIYPTEMPGERPNNIPNRDEILKQLRKLSNAENSSNIRKMEDQNREITSHSARTKPLTEGSLALKPEPLTQPEEVRREPIYKDGPVLIDATDKFAQVGARSRTAKASSSNSGVTPLVVGGGLLAGLGALAYGAVRLFGGGKGEATATPTVAVPPTDETNAPTTEVTKEPENPYNTPWPTQTPIQPSQTQRTPDSTATQQENTTLPESEPVIYQQDVGPITLIVPDMSDRGIGLKKELEPGKTYSWKENTFSFAENGMQELYFSVYHELVNNPERVLENGTTYAEALGLSVGASLDEVKQKVQELRNSGELPMLPMVDQYGRSQQIDPNNDLNIQMVADPDNYPSLHISSNMEDHTTPASGLAFFVKDNTVHMYYYLNNNNPNAVSVSRGLIGAIAKDLWEAIVYGKLYSKQQESLTEEQLRIYNAFGLTQGSEANIPLEIVPTP